MAPTPPPPAPGPDDPVRKWLYSLVIHVPPISMTVEGIEVNITNMVCEHITLGAIASAYIPPASFAVGVGGIGIACNGNFALSHNSQHTSGAAVADIANSMVNISISLKDGPDGLAVQAITNNCDIRLFVELDLKGLPTWAEVLYDVIKKPLENEIDKEVDKAIDAAVTKAINTDITSLLVAVDNKIEPFLHPPPTPVPEPVPAGSMNLRDNKLIKLIDLLLDSLIGADGKISINKIFNFLTHNTGAFNLDHLRVNHTFYIPGLADITLGVLAIDIAGLDTWSAFDWLEPVDNYTLASQTTLDSFKLNVTFFVQVNVTGQLADDGLYEEAKLIFSIADANFHAAMQTVVNQYKIDHLNSFEALNFSCLLTAVERLNMTDMSFNMTLETLEVEAGNGNVEQDIDDLFNHLVLLFITQYNPFVSPFFNGFIAGPIREGINVALGDLLHKSKCVAPASNDPSLRPTWIATGSAAITLIIVAIYVKRNMALSKNGVSDYTPLLINMSSSSSSGNTIDGSIAADPRVSPLWRYGIPFAILANIVLFIASNTGLGAGVFVVVNPNDGQEPLRTPSLFSFTLANSVRDMWEAKVYALSLLIAVFSGMWPYLKLLLMLFCWIVPERYLSVPRRENFLQALDALGKWSLIDTYVLTMMMVAFRFHVAVQTATVDVYVHAYTGFYTFLIGTMMSLVITHLILYMHRRLCDPQPSHYTEYERESLSRHDFTTEDGNRKYRFTPAGALFIAFLLVATLSVVVVGSVINSFDFEFQGLVGFLLREIKDSVVRPYSLISMGNALPDASEHPDSFGSRFIQAVFFTYAFGVPFAHLVVLFVLWVFPMVPATQRRWFHVAEVLNAWSALEVFVVSVIAALLEIRQFAQFIIGSRCDEINVILAKYLNKELDGDDRCFDVQAYLQNGCWVLFGACLFSIVTGMLVMRMSHRAIRDNIQGSSSSSWDKRQESRCKCCSCSGFLLSVLPCFVRDLGFNA